MVRIDGKLLESVTPTPEETVLAKESCRRLAALADSLPEQTWNLKIRHANSYEESISIPASVLSLLNQILQEMSQGHSVTLLPTHTELTTQQAADILKVSRPFLVDQLEKKLIPFRRIGSHRRILLNDLMNYKRQMEQNRLKALDDLAAQAQELGMGY